VKRIVVVVGLLVSALGAAAGARGADGPKKASNSRVAAKPKAAAGAAGRSAASVADNKEKVAAALDLFCKKWMGFLAVREHDNRGKIAWKPATEGVEGEYVGYSTDYACVMKDNPDPKAVPIATIKYREFLYRRRGASAEQAMETAPDVLEATEVTEIFCYAKGEWVY
jgi:hypothetical protein